MITIIHGDDIPSIVKKQDELVASGEWKTVINLQKEGVEALIEACEADALFTYKRIIVLENVQSIKGNAAKKIIECLKNYNDVSYLVFVLVATDVLTVTFLKHFKGSDIFLYRLPKFYFDFLDNLVPHKAQFGLSLLSRLSQTVTAEQIYYSMVKRIRLLLLLQLSSHNEFEDIKQLSPWQLTRLEKQSHLWTKEQLISFYKELFKLEIGMKTSGLSLPLLKHIDILLACALH